MYTFDSRIRYSEINHYKGTMDPSSIINYFQDCSTFQSEDLNLGISYLENKKRVWLLASWNLQILNQVTLGDYITVGTWPYAFKGFYGYRNFIMKDRNEKVISVADSIWVYMDIENKCPIKVPEDNAGYVLEPAYPMEHKDRKIAIPENLNDYPSFPVIKSNIDSYNHVNNGQYIKMAEEFLPDDFVVSNMRVEYKTQALLGDIIHPRISHIDNKYLIVLDSEEGKPFAVLEFNGYRKD
ncbi:MAG: acyl-[acyl-carrier-protein] thioesterase [Anaerolineaceae bacterium]|nr:MAG: acyl-[acyl-carrier-protein] thioesterase [Anaerolineaceae bacterium]